MSQFDFKGIITAIITPFSEEGEVDYESFKRLVEFQMAKGIQGLVINGTTAESPTLNKDEVKKIFLYAKEITGGSLPLILGTGTNSTRTTIENTKAAQDLGADAALVVVPYYNKPPQEGMVSHFKQVAESVDVPIILYNVPGRTVVSLSVDSIAELSKVKNIVGIKEASGKPEVVKELKEACSEGFVLLSGDDGSCLEFIANGGDGVISVISHLIPEELVRFSDRIRSGEKSLVNEYEKYRQLDDAIYMTSNPIPVKKAVELMGIIKSGAVRSPLVELNLDQTERLKVAMLEAGILEPENGR